MYICMYVCMYVHTNSQTRTLAHAYTVYISEKCRDVGNSLQKKLGDRNSNFKVKKY